MDTLTLQELLQLRKEIDARIEELHEQKSIMQIESDIKIQGYAYDKRFIQKLIVPGISYASFPLYIDIEAWIGEDTWENSTISGLSSKQNDWVKYTACDYIPVDGDDWQPSTRDEDWKIDYETATLRSTTTMIMYVYYQNSPPPKEGSSFKCFDCDGNIKNWTVKDSFLYEEGLRAGVLEEWNEYGLFVIKEGVTIHT